jgi:asparagine synthetase B (glutamine-hydrolysing)
LAPYYVENLTGWRKIEVYKDLILTVHPDLEVTQHGNSSKSITLLGYVLDPNKVEKTNFDIIDDFHDKIFKEKRNYFDPTFDFGGRWILIIKDVEDIILFNDAAGLRQVVYSDRKDDKYFWCASQPGLIAKELGLNIDSEALNFIEFIKARNDEYFMPGNSTPYREINHLFPNHYLNLNKKVCYRYWPKDEYIPTKIEEAAERCSHIVEGLMAAASNRFDLCLSLSSGLDSRLVLAGSRKIAKKITFISEVKKDTSINHPDVEIPKKI